MMIVREINDGKIVKSASEVYKYLDEFKNEDREYFIVIGLDTKNKPVYREVVSIGTLNSSFAHPREIFKKAIVMSCNSIIIAHNHPSGDTNPSKEDLGATKLIMRAGELLQIKLLDHVIIGANSYNSIIDEVQE